MSDPLMLVKFPVNLDAVLATDPSVKRKLHEATDLLTFIPFMTPDKFAESIGLSKGVVGGWIDQGYLPTAKIGRYRMINMVVLVANLKEGKVL
jgi:hypothetical protein